MLSRKLAIPLFALMLLMYLPAVAQAQVLYDDKKSYVQKGFFFSVEYGAYLDIVKPGVLTTAGGPSSGLLGHIGGISIGYDLADRFDLHFSFLSPQIGGDPQRGGGSASFLLSLGVTGYIVRSEQLYFYAKAGAGVMLVIPESLLGLTNVMAHGGLGLRYYTKMKHLSIGIEALALIRLPLDNNGLALGIGIMPTLMYTF